MGRKGPSGMASTIDGYNVKIDNPAGIPNNAITLDEFLALNGVKDSTSGWVLDKLKSNKQIGSQQGQAKFMKEYEAAEKEYQEKREAAKQKYKELVDAGILRNKTPTEKQIVMAHGNPDNDSVQAARKMLKKKGIDWRTGKKL